MIVNAIEAIGDKDGRIHVASGHGHCGRADLASMYLDDHLPEGEYAFLEISDTGCGMPPEIQARMFEPFFTTKFTGRGLGLAAVLGILRGHGGAVRVTSEPGGGTTSDCCFPHEANGNATASDSAAPAPAPPTPGAGPAATSSSSMTRRPSAAWRE